jgi:RNA polymerase sigma-70 factor (ECF subfamily)
MTSKNLAPETRQSLILRLRNPGDMLAWQEFVEVYQPLIRSLATGRGLQKADSDDVVQEVLTRVAKHIESWHSQSEHTSFRAWLATITRNQTIQFFRERNRRPATGVDSHINRKPSELQERDFDLEHDRQLFAWAARRVQSRFESKTWKAFWLTAVQESTVLETARQLEMSVSQVYVSRSRVMNALKIAVEQSEFESRDDWRIS